MTNNQTENKLWQKVSFGLGLYSVAISSLYFGQRPTYEGPKIPSQTIQNVELHETPDVYARSGLLLTGPGKSVRVPSIDAVVEVAPHAYPPGPVLPYASIAEQAGKPYTTLYVKKIQ